MRPKGEKLVLDFGCGRAKHSDAIGAERNRLSNADAILPGITCLWQVSGRSNVDFEDWMKMDLAYIDGWSFWQDLKILFRTVPAVLTAHGAK